MKNPRLVVGVFALLALAASATAVHFFAENLELRRQLAVASSPGAPAVQVADANAGREDPGATGERSPAAIESPPPGEPAIAGGPGGRREDRRARMAESASRLANDPEARAAMLGRMKSDVDRVYGDLFVKLGLNEDQVDMLRTLLAERQMARMEGEMLARFAGDEAARTAARATAEAKTQSIESGIDALLGPDGMSVIEDYQRSQPMRQVVSDVARRASYAGAPLSTEASDRLVSAMQSAAQEYPAGNNTSGGWRRETLTQQSVDTQLAALRAQNEAVLTQARSFLTQPQLEALVARQIEQFEQTQAQLNVRLRNPDAPFFGGGPGGPPPRP